MTSDELRRAYAAHVRRTAPAERAGCPSPDALAAAARGAADGAADTATLEHVARCAHCRPEFDLLRTVAAAARATATPPAVMQRRATAIALAAVVLLAAGIATGVWWRTPATVVRSDASDVTLVSPIPGRPPAPVERFVWRGIAGTPAYLVEVLDTTGALLVSRLTSDTLLVLSEEERAMLAPHDVIEWLVAARRVDGNERRSAVARVRTR